MMLLGNPVLGEEEKQALSEVIDSGWLTMGERVAAFEEAFADLHGVGNAVAVNSCTAGLHLCLTALGIGPGDEVLVPSVTFVATVNAVVYAGAAPVFVDIINRELPHISIADAEARCTLKTRAVIVMHYGGYLVDLAAWRRFADAHDLLLIEDAAHAPGIAEVGRWGDAAAFSFFTNKNMTTAEGGMVVARDPVVAQRIRQMRGHGMTKSTLERHRGHAYSYDVTMLGYNYRLDELRAAMGLVQLARLSQWNARRQALTALYRSLLSESLPEITVPFNSGHPTAAHIMPVLLPDQANREQVMSTLYQGGIQTSIYYPPVHQFSYYRLPGVALPHTENYCRHTLTLPLHPGLRETDVAQAISALRRAVAAV